MRSETKEEEEQTQIFPINKSPTPIPTPRKKRRNSKRTNTPKNFSRTQFKNEKNFKHKFGEENDKRQQRPRKPRLVVQHNVEQRRIEDQYQEQKEEALLWDRTHKKPQEKLQF